MVSDSTISLAPTNCCRALVGSGPVDFDHTCVARKAASRCNVTELFQSTAKYINGSPIDRFKSHFIEQPYGCAFREEPLGSRL